MRITTMLALASSSLLAAAAIASLEVVGAPLPPRRGTRYRPDKPCNGIALINRHTGLPHEHRREIERRTRQLALA